jgi:N-acetylglucosaminyldiphosphoundecaprenol N-acetyl-beta-D-mannosaminyltransferase
MRNPIAILGVPIDDLDTEQVIGRIGEMVASRRFHQVATANTDFVVRAAQDPELRTILRVSDLVVPDGMPIVLASKWLGAPLKERVAGADLVPRLCELAAEKGWRLFVVGARPEVARVARAKLEARYPGIQIVGWVSPPNSHVILMDNASILSEIEAAKPDLLLVAFGNPKQEKWIHMHRDRLQAPVCIGVGGSFDFIAGATRRAPLWMQRAGLEWFHRLTHEPRRLWRRYFGDFVHFARFLARQLWVSRSRAAVGGDGLSESRVGDCTVLAVRGAVGGALLERLRAAAQAALDARTHVVLDLENATSIDSQALGTLLNLPRRALHVGREVRVSGARGRTLRALRMAGAQECSRMTPTLAEALSGAPSVGLTWETEHEKDGLRVRLVGVASVSTLGDLRAALSQAGVDAGRVFLDLRGLTYVDCAAVAELRAYADNVAGGGRRLDVARGAVLDRFLDREGLAGLFGSPARE